MKTPPPPTKTLTRTVCLMSILLSAAAGAATTFGTIERLDPRVDVLLPPDAQLEVIADGFHWLEGPAWNRAGGYLLFSDIPANAIYRWDPASGVSLFMQPSGYSGSQPFAGREPGSNGLTFDAQGRLTICEHGDRRIRRLEFDGSKTVLADRYEGRRLNSPNDAVYRSNGDLYFTDPPFGLPGTFEDPEKELDLNGVYRLTPEGDLELLEGGIAAPNGIAFSPDEKRLYLTDVDPERMAWLVYEVAADGTLGDGRIFASAMAWKGERAGAPDGIEVDGEGNLYGAGPEGIYLFAPDGTHLGTLFTGVPTGNLTWGEDGSTLFITADTRLMRLRVTAKGAGF